MLSANIFIISKNNNWSLYAFKTRFSIVPLMIWNKWTVHSLHGLAQTNRKLTTAWFSLLHHCQARDFCAHPRTRFPSLWVSSLQAPFLKRQHPRGAAASSQALERRMRGDSLILLVLHARQGRYAWSYLYRTSCTPLDHRISEFPSVSMFCLS